MLRWLALGDSYTIGEGVAAPSRWPNRLLRLLRRRHLQLARPKIIARTGFSCAELLSALNDQQPRGPYQLVSLLIGVNDQYRGHAVERYREGLNALLDRAEELASGQGATMMLSIPDWGTTPFALAEGRDRIQIAAELNAYNQQAAELAASRAVPFVDITAISREPLAALTADSLHPGPAQYKRWAEAAADTAEHILRFRK